MYLEMKKTSLNVMAAMAMGLAVVSCSHDSDGYMPSSEEQLANATEKLGVEVDPNQDWNMTGTVTATVSVNLGLDQNYTVGIYDANPLFNKGVHFYAKEGIAEGGSIDMSFEAPSAASTFYVAVFDSKGRYLVQAAPVVDGAMDVTFGTTVSGTRATEAEYTNTYAKTLEDFLNVSDELNPYYQTVNTISVSDFANYTLLTNDLIVNEAANRTLTNASWMAGLDGAYPGHGDGKHYRVAAGEEVTEFFHVSIYNGFNAAVIYVEGTLHLNGNTLNGVTLVVGNGGKIIIDGKTDMSNAGRIVVMEGGSIEGKDGVTFNINNGAPSYNAGTINFKGELNANGSIFYNCNTINVDVLRNTSGGKITNFGHITARTNTGAGDTYNCTFVNGCYTHYTENAGIGQLTMLKNSRLDVDGVCEFGQSWNDNWNLNATTPENTLTFVPANPNILMDKSVINVGTAFVTNTVFKGPSSADEIAIVKMDKVQVGNGTDLMQRDNCYFDWDITELYNKQGEKYQDIPAEEKQDNKYGYVVDFYRGHVTKFITEASSPVSIPAAVSDDDCTGAGYNPNAVTPAPIEEGPAVWSYAFEDTPLGDYDMNDVVIKVRYHYDEATQEVTKKQLDVTLCCTGATLELKVYLDKTALFGGKEVHELLNCRAPQLVNTGAGPDSDPSTFTTTIDTPANFEFGTADFWIDSPLVPGGVHIAKQGQDPHGIVIPADWAWPTEYTCIKDAYPSFKKFAEDASVKSEWYKETPVAGKTYKKQ